MNIVNWAVNMLFILTVKRGQKLTVKKKSLGGSLVPTPHTVFTSSKGRQGSRKGRQQPPPLNEVTLLTWVTQHTWQSWEINSKASNDETPLFLTKKAALIWKRRRNKYPLVVLM